MNLSTPKSHDSHGKHRLFEKKPQTDWGVIIKTTVLMIFLIAAAGAFGYFCNQTSLKYLSILAYPEIIFHGVWALVFIFALMVGTGLAATLVRPVWLMVLGYFAAGAAIVIAWKIDLVPAIFGVLYALGAVLFSLSVAKKIGNQIKFSFAPLVEAQKIMLMLLGMTLCAGFGLGYFNDATRRNFAIPPESKTQIMNFMTSQFQTTIDTMSKQVPDQIQKNQKNSKEDQTAALEKLTKEFRKSLDDADANLMKILPYLAAFFALMLFTVYQTALLLFSWLPAFVYTAVFPLFRLTHMTNIVKETVEAERLTL